MQLDLKISKTITLKQAPLEKFLEKEFEIESTKLQTKSINLTKKQISSLKDALLINDNESDNNEIQIEEDDEFSMIKKQQIKRISE